MKTTPADRRREAWRSITYYDNSVGAAGTGELVSVRDKIEFELACRPNRGEFEDALAMVRRSLPQTLLGA